MSDYYVQQVELGFGGEFEDGASGTVSDSTTITDLGTYNYNLQDDLTGLTVIGWRYEFEVTAGAGQITLVATSDGVGPGTTVNDSTTFTIPGPGVYTWTTMTLAPDLVTRLAYTDFPHVYGVFFALSGGPFDIGYFRFIAELADETTAYAIPPLVLVGRDDDLTEGPARLVPPPSSLQYGVQLVDYL